MNPEELETVANGGLLHRRALIKLSALGISAAAITPAQARETWMTHAGSAQSEYGSPSKHANIKRLTAASNPLAPEAGVSYTPLQALNGTITPNALHFERHHSGVPDIDPVRHRLTVYGDVKQVLQFSYEDLLAYPLVSRFHFMECSGNSFLNTLDTAQDLNVQSLHGLLSAAEWTGVPLHYLLDEAGVAKEARWIVAEGADASGHTRSLPVQLSLDKVMVALYQNGEPLRPEQGYPMRLFVPGCEGNVSVKWLQSIKVQKTPAYSREETSKYTELLPNGKAEMFSLEMGVKSVITTPSGTMQLGRKGVYEISGLAWSGAGAIRKVEVSADGGNSWAEAALQSSADDLALTRFRIPWRWNGQHCVLQSRAIDSAGHVQPTRSQALARYSAVGFYHYNGIQSWQVDATGRVQNVYS